MDHGNGGSIIPALQVFVEAPQLPHQEHALIDDGPGRQGADIGILRALFEFPAHHIEPSVEFESLFQCFRPFQEALPDGRHAAPGSVPQDLRMNGDLPPEYDGHPLLAGDHLKKASGEGPLQAVAGQEEHTDSVVPLFPKVRAQLSGLICIEGVADLQKNAYAVAHRARSVLSGPVLQLLHDAEGVIHDTVFRRAVDLYHRPDSCS